MGNLSGVGTVVMGLEACLSSRGRCVVKLFRVCKVSWNFRPLMYSE